MKLLRSSSAPAGGTPASLSSCSARIIGSLLLMMLLPLIGMAQESENKIKDAIDSMLKSHPLRLGIFRIEPKLVLNSGYDSNAIYLPSDIESDYTFSAAPSADVALKLGRRGYLSLREDLNFVYYREQEPLRSIYNTTSGKIVTGSRKILLTLSGGYLSRTAPYDFEYDVPVNQKATSGAASR